MHRLRRILIIKPSSLGDVATALPLLCDLHAAFPDAQIDWVVNPAYAALVQGHPYVHEVLYFHRAANGAGGRTARWRKLGELLATVRQRQYDCAIDAQGLLRSGIIAYASDAPVRIGPADAREGAVFLYTHRAPTSRASQLAVVRMRALAEELGVHQQQPPEFAVPIEPQSAARAAEMLPAPAPVVLIPGARWESKRWPAEHFAAIAAKLLACGKTVAVLGAPAEQQACDRAAADPRVLNFAGKTSLAEMVALLARAALVVSNDTGPLHVAAALGRPVVGIYGPTDPASVGPYGQLHRVVRAEPPAISGGRGEADFGAMASIGVEDVWKMVRQVLQE